MKNETLRGVGMSAYTNFAPLLTSAITGAHPAVAAAMTVTAAVLGFYGDYANTKTLELLKDLDNNRDRIVDDIVKSDRFRAAFVKAVADNITEGNEKKREMLRRYVVNFACGVEPDFDEHTRMLQTLGSITVEEFEVLLLFRDGGPISRMSEFRSGMSLCVGDIERVARKTAVFRQNDPRNEHKNWVLMTLGYKGLLLMLTDNNFGSGQEVKVKGLTSFGSTFLRYVMDDTKDAIASNICG